MKSYLATLCSTLIIFSANANASFEPTQYSCAGIESKIDKIKDKMRSGYSIKEGEILKEQLRQLRSNRNECQKKRLSVK